MDNPTFGSLFKRYRLRSGFFTLHDFGDVLAKHGYVFEDSLFSRWQKNTRIPKRRQLLLTIIKIFLERQGLTSIQDINSFLETAGQGRVTEHESTELCSHTKAPTKKISPDNALDFFLAIARSKRVIRSGWKREKIKNPESIAEHSFQLNLMAVIMADLFGTDLEKLIKMALVHDLGEVVTGDTVWSRGGDVNDSKRMIKEKREEAGLMKIFRIVDKNDEYKKIFDEMREKKTLEAKIFRQLDKLEMAIQALVYEKENHIKLDEFFINADLHLHSPFLRKIFEQAIGLR